MRLLPGRRGRLAELDARVADATERAQRAQAEAEKSEQRYESVHTHVVQPLLDAAGSNSFSDLIRRSLVSGGSS